MPAAKAGLHSDSFAKHQFHSAILFAIDRLEDSLGVNSALDGIRPKVEANNGAETRPLKSVEHFQYL